MSIKEEIIAINKKIDKLKEIRAELKIEMEKFDKMIEEFGKDD